MTYAVSYLSMLEHVGTHVDAPAHIGRRGSVDQVPLDWFTGKAVCLDVRHVGDLGDIDVADLERAEEQAGVTSTATSSSCAAASTTATGRTREVVTEPRHHHGREPLARRRLSRARRRGPVDGQGGNEGVPEPPRLPRPGDDPLRVAGEPRAAAGEGRVPVHRLSAQAEGRDRVARARDRRAGGLTATVTPEPGLPAEFQARTPTVAHVVAEYVARLGVRRVFSLPGGHVKPIWNELLAAGVEIVAARHEAAAVHMAHAEAELAGRLAVALVTAGPGVANAVTGIGGAHLARVPVLVLSARIPRRQAGMGALEEISQVELVRPLCRSAVEVGDVRHVLPKLDAAAAAALGDENPPGPAYVDFPTDLLHEIVPAPYRDERWLGPRRRAPVFPDPAALEQAAELVRQSRRPLVVAGRAAIGARLAVARFLQQTGAVYLDTRESRGTLPPDDPSSVPAVRARALAEADLVIALGRRLDFELAYGSPAVFSPAARFVRVGRTRDELAENRRGDVEVRGDVDLVLEALLLTGAAPTEPDRGWREGLAAANAEKAAKLAAEIRERPVGADGRMHPLALLEAVNRVVDPESIVIADGGDILSFARVGLRAPTYLDVGPFGCIGAGTPFAVAASLTFPERRVVAVVGDGSFGFNAMEIETAVRTGARPLVVVANNAAWNIERHDQLVNYDGVVVGTELSACRYDLLAKALGAHGEHVEEPSELPGALERGLANAPAVVDVAVTREAVSPDSRAALAAVPPLHAVVPWDEAERRLLGG